ncbi:MAG: GTPase Era [Acidobacteriota bacterium]
MTEKSAVSAPSRSERAGLKAPSDDEVTEGHRCGFVTLFGRSNVGKSTLLNRLVGEKVAIVSEVPQTTRRRLTGIRNHPDAQVIYVDTPGIHKPRFVMNQRMVASAMASLEGIDLVLIMVDGSTGIGPGDRFVMEVVRKRELPTLVLLNKIDLMKRDRLLELTASLAGSDCFDGIVPISARTGENVDRLEEQIRQRLPPGPRTFPVDTLTEASERFLAGETIREKIILNTRQELPHSTAVLVERFHRSQKGLLEVDALVIVEKESQKAILIGRKGEMMRRIATSAREEIESRLGEKVFLQVWVKVAPRWRMDKRFLDQMDVQEGMRPGVST